METITYIEEVRSLIYGKNQTEEEIEDLADLCDRAWSLARGFPEFAARDELVMEVLTASRSRPDDSSAILGCVMRIKDGESASGVVPDANPHGFYPAPIDP